MAGIAAVGELTAAPSSGQQWELSLALPGDDVALRALLRRSVIPGAVRIAFTREPHYGAGDGLAGAEDFTLMARRDGVVVAMGRCSVHTLHRNGQLHRIGYLGELRVLPGTPSSARLLRDGYAVLAEVATHAEVDGFVTSIADDNLRARRVLERGRRFGLPAYLPLTPLVTIVAPVLRRALSPRVDPTSSTATCSELTEFLQRHAARAQLTLSWDAARWAALARHGITPESFTVVRRNGEVVAAAAVWDQRAFRQTVIDGYGRALRLARPVVNAAQWLRGVPPLPPPGTVLAQGALLGTTVPEGRDWPALWDAVQGQAASAGLSWLAVTRGASDPQLRDVRRLTRAREYHTTLYDVVWRERPTWNDPWGARPYHPEVGLL